MRKLKLERKREHNRHTHSGGENIARKEKERKGKRKRKKPKRGKRKNESSGYLEKDETRRIERVAPTNQPMTPAQGEEPHSFVRQTQGPAHA
jgi:hypothetical protein